MKKFIKRLLLTSLLVVGGSYLVACNKDDEGGNLIANLSVEMVTTEEPTTTEVATTEVTTEELTTEAITEEVKEERPDYIVTDEIDTASIPSIAVEGSDTNPAKQGEWTQALKTVGSDEPRQTLYFRTTEVLRGEEAMTVIREYESNDGFFKFGDLGYEDLEYCVMTYQVYFPEGYLEQDWGISFTDLAFHVADGDNAGFINNYVGMEQTYDISERVKNKTLYAGDVLERQMVFVMVKDYTDYMLYYRYYDDDYNEFTKYVACEIMPTGAQVNETTVETETADTPTTDDITSKTNIIPNGVYKVTGVQYSDGTYVTKEQLEKSAGQPFNVYFTVFGDTCLFDASGAGDGLGKSSGTITQTGSDFTFTDSAGNVFSGTYDEESNSITIDMSGTDMIFEPYE